MNNPQNQTVPSGDIRSFLKSQHRKVYSICRIFATNYKEQQALFANMLAAISHSIMGSNGKRDKNNLLLRACINMAALHSITLGLEAHGPQSAADKEIRFKSPDFQNSMLKFREAVGEISDDEKICLFLQLEDVGPDEIRDLVGASHAKTGTAREWSWSGRDFIPYLKQKLVWS
jgi:hypothetical protein